LKSEIDQNQFNCNLLKQMIFFRFMIYINLKKVFLVYKST